MTRVSERGTVLVIGDGVIGLTIAAQLATRGIRVALVAPGFSGAASAASAGMLAPSIERTQGAGQAFSDAAPAAWLRLRDALRAHGGGEIAVNTAGILRVALTPMGAEQLRTTVADGDRWLTRDEAVRLVPTLADITGAVLYANNGWVDVPRALTVLREFVRTSACVTLHRAALASLRRDAVRMTARLTDDTRVEADHAVIATGAWTPETPGALPTIPVTPLRGALLLVEGSVTGLPVYAAEGHAYVLPRGDCTVVGATSDSAAFDAAPREDDASRLIREASRLFPSLPERAHRAVVVGLRPMTPDGLPIMGPDPSDARVIYACGHGRNGFLQAALTAEVVADLVGGAEPDWAVGAFSPSRFGRQ